MIQKLHITEIEEFLAETYVNNSQNPFSLTISKSDDQGNLEIDISTVGKTRIDAQEIDFELSPCECVDLDRLDINYYKNKVIYTSSALELVDYFLAFNEEFECLVDFKDASWKVMII